MQSRQIGARRPWLALAGLVLALALAFPAAAAQQAGRVTAALGDARSGGEPLEQLGTLEDGADVETGGDGGCSMLLDEDLLLELCGDTKLRVERKAGDGPRVVRMERGSIRMMVEPRLVDERVEIHTPAAIATILGTVLHVTVDALGVTTVTSAVSRVLVESADPKQKGTVTLTGMDRVEVTPGLPLPPRPTAVSEAELAQIGSCLGDFHQVAMEADRGSHEDDELDETIDEDLFEGDLPQVAAGPDGGAPGGPDGGFDPTQNDPPGGGPTDPNDPVLEPNETGAGGSPGRDGDVIIFPGGDCPFPGEGCGF